MVPGSVSGCGTTTIDDWPRVGPGPGTSLNTRRYNMNVLGGKIASIENNSGVRFPYSIGQHWNRSIETWACTNKFKIDGEDPCPEEKIFGIRKKDIPMGHELRMMYPSKFRK